MTDPSFHEIQKFNRWWHYAIAATPLAVIFITGLAFYFDQIHKPAAFAIPVAAVLFSLVTFLWFLKLRLETRIDETGLYVHFHGIPWCKRHIAWNDISSINIVNYSPLSDYGGWGVRYGMAGNGWCYNISGNTGIRLVYRNGKNFLVGTQKADVARAAIQHYFKP